MVPVGLRGREFVVKRSSRGYPWNFSHYRAAKGGRVFEIHANLSVQSAYRLDDGYYVVDVAVVRSGAINARLGKKFVGVANAKLVTFIESKALVVYPMLLAQFIGIVHELLPGFLRRRRPPGFKRDDHFDPTMVSLGYIHARSSPIRRAYEGRGFFVGILEESDEAIRQLSRDRLGPSPLARGAK
jgi:hypothetical protein